jgi:hypothetical protein
MAAQQPVARRLLLRGQRLENSKQMKAFALDAIGLHLLGEYPYKNTDDLVAALNEADPKGTTWERQRLEYHMNKIRGQMLAAQRTPAVRRPAETSPSDADLTEGFGVGEDAPGALDFTVFGGELPEDTAAAELPPPPNPLGGRPIGTTLAASRDLKEANAELMDSATRAWATKSTALAPAGLGGITPLILTHTIKNVWGPCYPTRSAEEVVGSLCDAYGYHCDKEVLDAMQEEFFVGIMGVPNATGLWQVADIRNNDNEEIAALKSQIRELEAAIAAGWGGGGSPAAAAAAAAED